MPSLFLHKPLAADRALLRLRRDTMSARPGAAL